MKDANKILKQVKTNLQNFTIKTNFYNHNFEFGQIKHVQIKSTNTNTSELMQKLTKYQFKHSLILALKVQLCLNHLLIDVGMQFI